MAKLKELIADMVSKHIKFGVKGRNDLRDDPAAYHTDLIINDLQYDERCKLVASLLDERGERDRLDFITHSAHHEKISVLFTRYLSSDKNSRVTADFANCLANLAFDYHYKEIEESINGGVANLLREIAENARQERPFYQPVIH